MFIDAQLQFSDAQALTSTAASTNVIDLGVDRNIGQGEPMAVMIVLDVAADDADADETYTAAIQTDDNVSFSSATTLETLTITRGDAAGSKYFHVLKPDTLSERYLRINYTLGGTSPSVTATAFLIPSNMIDAYNSYADGFTIS